MYSPAWGILPLLLDSAHQFGLRICCPYPALIRKYSVWVDTLCLRTSSIRVSCPIFCTFVASFSTFSSGLGIYSRSQVLLCLLLSGCMILQSFGPEVVCLRTRRPPEFSIVDIVVFGCFRAWVIGYPYLGWYFRRWDYPRLVAQWLRVLQFGPLSMSCSRFPHRSLGVSPRTIRLPLTPVFPSISGNSH